MLQLAGDDVEVATLANKILEAIGKEPLYYTDIAERVLRRGAAGGLLPLEEGA